MVPYELSKDRFASMYQRKLDRLSDHAVRTFQSLPTLPIAPGVDEANLEIFPDEYGGTPDVCAYWCGKNNKVDHADPSLFPGSSLELEPGLNASQK